MSPAERRSLNTGDIVTWDVLKVPAGSPESRPVIPSGTISGRYEGGVLIDRKRADWPDFRIPLEAITSHFVVEQSSIEKEGRPRRRARGPDKGEGTLPGAAAAASTREESALTRQLRSEIERLATQVRQLEEDRAKEKQAKRSAKSYQRTAGKAKLGKEVQRLKELQGELHDVNQELQRLHEIAESERPLRERPFHMKTSDRGKPVPNNIRDLVVELRTKVGIAGEKSLEVVQMTLEAIGAKLQDRVKKHDALALSNACLVETALMLEDDQYRRMAEELREGPEREIRAQEWTAEEAAAAKEAEAMGIAAHKSAVLDKVESWLHNPRYKPRDLPNPEEIDVGDLAATGQDFESALCALLFLGMDATTHARCELAQPPPPPGSCAHALAVCGVGTIGLSSPATSVATKARPMTASSPS
jgi:hypothetical protein